MMACASAGRGEDDSAASKQLMALLDTECKIKDGVLEKINTLLKSGARKDYTDSTGRTYLHVYMRKLQQNFDHPDWQTVIDLLLNHGCDIDAQDLNKATPLFLFLCNIPHSAYQDQDVEEGIMGRVLPTPQQALQVVKKLINSGAAVNKPGYYNDSPLYSAVCAMNLEVCNILLEANANGNINSLLGGNALYALANSGDDLPDVPFSMYAQMVDLLVKKGKVDIDMPCIDRSRIVQNATGCCSLNLIDLLVRYGADYKAFDGYGRNILHYAATNTDPEVLIYFIQKGIDVNSGDVYKFTPLHMACAHHNVEAVRELLNSGADLTARSNVGVLPIHLCCGIVDSGYRDEDDDITDMLTIVEILIEAGGEINALDKYENTILHYNAFTDSPPHVLKYLLDAGSDLMLRDRNDLTAMEVAVKQGNIKAASVLGFKSCKLLPTSAHGDHLTTVDEISDYTCAVSKEIEILKKQKTDMTLDTLSDVGLHTTDARLEANLCVRDQVEQFFREVVAEVGKLDSRFEGTLICSGSMYENVRIGRPNEFDYMVELTSFSAVVSAFQPMKNEPGFSEVLVGCGTDSGMDEFVSCGKLKSSAILASFKTLMREAIFRVYQKGHEYIYGGFLDLAATTPFQDIDQKNTLFSEGIIWSCSTYKPMRIMVDLNPVVYVKSWPEQCRRSSFLLSNLQKLGVYAIPKNLDREMYYDDQFVWRISFSHLETMICQTIPECALEAYRIIKALRECPISPIITTSNDHERMDKSKCEITNELSDQEGSSSGSSTNNDGLVADSDDADFLSQLEQNRIMELSGTELIKTFYLKQLFLIELDSMANKSDKLPKLDNHGQVSVHCPVRKLCQKLLSGFTFNCSLTHFKFLDLP